MEAVETFEHAGYRVMIYPDFEPMSPAEWDNLGSLVIESGEGWSFAERETTKTEDDAIIRGGAKLLVRYLRLVDGVIAVPFHLADYGSSGTRIWATDETDDSPSGYIYTTHRRVTELCGDGAEYHTQEWIENALRDELKVWAQYVEGDVYGFTIEDADGNDVDSLWGLYGFEYAKQEARAACEGEAKYEAKEVVKIGRAMAL